MRDNQPVVRPPAGTDGANLADRPAVKYVGVRTPDGTTVALEDDRGGVRPLPSRTDLRRHSPAGLEWGFAGSGPAQLALALLADAVGPHRAEFLYQKFKVAVVAALPRDRWELSRDDILRWVAEHERPEDQV